MDGGDKTMKTVEKKWGKEVWIINNKYYCGKFLYIHRGGQSSYHYHKKKMETFVCTDGSAKMIIDDKEFVLDRFSEPITIKPKTPHSFRSGLGAVLVEVSTHHDEKDVVRLTESG